jgi:hypothetical protein
MEPGSDSCAPVYQWTHCIITSSLAHTSYFLLPRTNSTPNAILMINTLKSYLQDSCFWHKSSSDFWLDVEMPYIPPVGYLVVVCRKVISLCLSAVINFSVTCTQMHQLIRPIWSVWKSDFSIRSMVHTTTFQLCIARVFNFKNVWFDNFVVPPARVPNFLPVVTTYNFFCFLVYTRRSCS